MKKQLMLATAGAALMALAMPISASALSVTLSDIANAKGFMNPAGHNSATTSAPAMEPNAATLMKDMSANATAVAKIKSLGSDADVQVVRVAALTKKDAAGFAKSMSADQTAIGNLRTAIKDNSALSGALKTQDIALDKVIAAKVDVAGHLVIYSNS